MSVNSACSWGIGCRRQPHSDLSPKNTSVGVYPPRFTTRVNSMESRTVTAGSVIIDMISYGLETVPHIGSKHSD